MKKKIIWGVVVVVVVLLFVALLNKDNAGRDSILVSANIPLSGDLAVYGEYIRNGAELAYSDLKADYENVPEIIFDWQDNLGTTKDAVTVFQRQIINNPDLYISGLKPQTASISDMVTREGVPHFTWILDILINENSDNNIRTLVNFRQESEVFLNYLESKNPSKVYMIYVNLDSAVNQYEGIVRPALVEMGLGNNNVKTEAFGLDRTDFRDIALKVKSFNPDYIIINGFIPHILSMTKDFRNMGLIKDGNTLASIDMLDTAQLLSNAEVEGIVVASPKYLIDFDNRVVTDWNKHYEDTYGKKPTYFDAYAYDMMKVIFEAASQMDFPANSNEWLSTIKNLKTKGITGSIGFDEDLSLITEMYPAVYRNGILVPLTR